MATWSVQTPFGGGSGYDLPNSILEIGVNNLLGNAFSGFVGSYFGKKSSKKQMQMQQEMMKWQALNMPTFQKQGLIDAGYNPLLAVMNNANQAQMPSAYQTYQAMANLGSNSAGGASFTPFKGETERQIKEQNKNMTKRTSLDNTKVELENKVLEQQVRKETAEAHVAEDLASANQIESNIRELNALFELEALGWHPRRSRHAGVEVYPADDIFGPRGYDKQYKDEGNWPTRVFAKRERIDADFMEAYEDSYRAKLSQIEAEIFSDFLGSAEGRDLFQRKIRNQMEQDVYRNSREHQIWEDSINAIHGINEGSSAYENLNRGRRPRSMNINIYNSRKE